MLGCQSSKETPAVGLAEKNQPSTNKKISPSKQFNKAFWGALKNDDLEELTTFLKNVDPNKRINNVPLLHWAVKDKSLKAVKLLIEKGADIHSTNGSGISALATSFKYNSLDITNYLLTQEAKFDNKSAGKELYRAITNSDLINIQFLVKAGVDINKKHTNYSFLYTPIGRFIPLEIAEDPIVIEELLSLGANPNFNVGMGLPFIYTVLREPEPNKLSLLIKYGVEYNKKYRVTQNTPLHFAVFLGNEKAVQILLENNANKHLRDSNMQKPIDIAVEKGFSKIEAMLK